MEQNTYLDRERIEEVGDLVARLGESIHIDDLREEYESLNRQTLDPDFWEDSTRAQKIVKEQNAISSKIKTYDQLSEEVEEASMLLDLMEEEEDFSFYDSLKASIAELEKKSSEFKLETLLSGEYDNNNAILSIHAGAGGTEAQDWADMLLRMYTRYAEQRGYKVKTLDILKEEEAGIKSATLLISGPYAYGYLKAEKGVHRLVRISPFDSAKKRHTSFASVDVYPEFDDDIEIEIRDEDINIDTYRASGAGGQHVNTTDSAVRITHIPTGIVVQCQNERSQTRNKETAMAMLKARLVTLAEEEKKEKIEDLHGNYSQIAWGSQIRSYVFHPYTMVKDHRTNFEVGDVNRVMDGDIEPFINAYLETREEE